MKERYLGDGVRWQHLPLLDVPTSPDAPDLKRLDLPQGQLAQLCPPDLSLRYLAWAELREGGIRGNHLHHFKQEWIYLIAGEIELVIEDPSTAKRERETLVLAPGDLVTINPRIAHALRPLRDGHCLEFSPQPFDPADVERYPLV